MPPRKKPSALDLRSVADGFATKLEQVQFKPNINRYQPMPKQDIFHQRQNRHRVVKGGNRAGKTYSSTADDVQVLLRRHPHRQHLYENRPLRMRFIGVDFERGIEGAALPLFSQFIPPSKLVNGAWEDSFHRQRMLLTLADGSTCNFMSYEQDPDKFQAVWLDHIHCDEEPPKAIYSESRLRLIDKNGTMTISMTPVQQMEWLEDDVINPALEGRLPGWSVDELDTEENIHLSAEALADLSAGMTAEEKLIRLKGGYSDTTKVFPEFKGSYPNVINHEEFIEDLRGDRDWRFFESMDYGYTNPTAWLWTAVHPDGRIVTFKELYAARVEISTWCELVKQTRAEIADMIGRSWTAEVTVGDPSISRTGESAAATGMSIQQLYALGGIYIGTEGIVKARSGNPDVGLEKIHMYLRRRLAVGRDGEFEAQPWWQVTLGGTEGEPTGCPHLISELRTARTLYQTLTQKEKANPKENIRDKNNHAIDAIKYLFIVTHDLRPARYREEQDRLPDEVLQRMMPRAYAAQRFDRVDHTEPYYATVSPDTHTEWEQ